MYYFCNALLPTLVVGLPTIQMSAEVFFFPGSVMTRLTIRAQLRSFRLIFCLEYEYDEVRLVNKLNV